MSPDPQPIFAFAQAFFARLADERRQITQLQRWRESTGAGTVDLDNQLRELDLIWGIACGLLGEVRP